MTTWTKKRVAWALMSGGMGAALLFGTMVALRGHSSQIEWQVYFWPCGGVLLGVAGWIWLRRLFCAEPPEPPAAWTVTLTDLIVATVFAGCCSAIFTGLGVRFERLVPAVGLMGFALYMHSALAASLLAVFSAWRVPFVVANIGLTLGAMGWLTMGLLSVLIVCIGEHKNLVRFWFDVLFDWDQRAWIRMIQICVYALPIGWVSMALVKWQMAAERDVLRP